METELMRLDRAAVEEMNNLPAGASFHDYACIVHIVDKATMAFERAQLQIFKAQDQLREIANQPK